MMKLLSSAAIIFTLLIGVFSPVIVRADDTDPLAGVKAKALSSLNQLPDTSPQAVIGLAIRVLTAFMGAIMFLLIIYGGILWMTAQGNSDKIDKAKNIMVWAALGSAVMLASYILVNYVFSALGNS